MEDSLAGLRELARALLHDSASADDVTQETWLRAAAGPPRRVADPRAWLRRVARNVALTMRAAKARRARRERVAARPDRLPSAAEMAARIEIQRKVWEAVAGLEEPYRSAVVFRYFDGLAPREIAARLGVPVKTVRTRLNRALAMLRARLDAGRGRHEWTALLLPLALPRGPALPGALTVVAMKKVVAVCLVLALGAVLAVWTARPGRNVPGSTARGTDVRARAPLPEVAPPSATHAEPVVPAEGVAFAGRVVDEEGRGVPGAAVRLVFWKGRSNDTRNLLRRDRERHEEPATVADAQGWFRMERPHPSTSFLRADADGFAAGIAGPHVPAESVVIVLPRAPRLRVRVLDPERAPVEGAEVRLVTMLTPWTGDTRQVLAAQRTDADGWAAVPAVPVSSTRLEVDPREPDLGIVETGAEAAGTQEVVVPRVATQDWTLVDADTGAPLADGYVLLFTSGGSPSFFDEPLRRRFDADARGVVRCPAQDGYYGRLATAPGYEILPVDRKVMPLRRAMRVDGRVVDSAGAPVAGAAILLATTQGFAWDLYAWRPLVQAWTDAEGRFALDVTVMAPAVGVAKPDTGFRSVIALAEGRGFAVEDAVPVVPGSRRALTLRLAAPATLEVEMVRPTGEPVAGQWLQILREVPRAPSWPEVEHEYGADLVSLLHFEQTDAEGMFVASPLPPGRYRIRAENTVIEVHLAEGEHERVRMAKGAGACITGVVLDAAGNPMAGLTVAAANTVVRTDGEGRFRFDDVGPGEHRVAVLPPRWPNFLVVPGAKPGADLVIRVPEGLSRLRVVVEEPADEVEYALETATGGGHAWSELPDSGETLEFTPGAGIVVVRARGRGWTWARFDAAPARTTDVRVSFPRPGAVEGTAAPGGLLRAERLDLPADHPHLFERTGVAAARADSEGRFRFEGLPPGRYRVSLGTMREGGWQETAGTDVEVPPGEVASVTLD